MPISSPVVNGMPSLPASAIVRRPRAGTLSGARLPRVAAERAVAAVVAAERRQRHEDLRREGHGAAATAIADIAGAGQQVVEGLRTALDQRARLVMRNRRRRHFRRASFGRTSLAKRSMFFSPARSSG